MPTTYEATSDGSHRVVDTDGDDSLQRARSLAKLLDSAVTIPGTKITVGVDALLGLVPGIGDALATLLSAQIVVLAARVGVPVGVLVRMLGNILLDAAVGVVPLLGDIFDVVFRSNQRNLALLERHARTDPGARRGAKRRMLGAVAVIFGIALGIAVLAAWVVWKLIDVLVAAVR